MAPCEGRRERELGGGVRRELPPESDPALMSLRTKADVIRRHELEKARSKLRGLAPAEQEEIERVTRVLVEKIVDLPASEIAKEISSPARNMYVQTLRQLFRLDQ